MSLLRHARVTVTVRLGPQTDVPDEVPVPHLTFACKVFGVKCKNKTCDTASQTNIGGKLCGGGRNKTVTHPRHSCVGAARRGWGVHVY